MGKTNHYDEEFRRNAVDLLASTGKPLKRVAADLGVSPNALRAWRNRLLAQNGGGGSGAAGTAGSAAMTGEQLWSELQRLRKENEYLRRQRDILKKAALILGEDPR